MAQAWNVPLAPHIHGSAVAVAAAVHLLAGIPNGRMAGMVFPAHPLMAELVKDPLLVARTGHIELSERPGLGSECDPKVVSQYRVGGSVACRSRRDARRGRRESVGGSSDRGEAPGSRFAHVFFDLDGTLIDPRHGIVKSIQYALHALGEPTRDPSSLERFIGPPLAGTFRQLLGTNDGERVQQAIAAYRVRFGASGVFESRVYDGIPEALRALGKSGRGLFVVTSKPGVYARTIVDHHKLRRHFRGVYGAELNGERSDKATLIRYVLDEEGLSPCEVLMVGDRVHDVVGARENGVACVAVGWGYGCREELETARPDAVVESVFELMEWLDGPGGCPGSGGLGA